VEYRLLRMFSRRKDSLMRLVSLSLSLSLRFLIY
jgi:hypothetical protein